MSIPKIEDVRFSMSSIDEFLFGPRPRPRTAAVGKVRIGGVSELAGFQFISSDKLVRLSQKDFWKLGQDNDGYYIERLVSDDDGPIKE